MTTRPNKKEITPRLEGNLVSLVRQSPKYAETYYEALQDPRIVKCIGTLPPKSLDAQIKYLRDCQQKWRKRTDLQYAIILNETGEPVGGVGLMNISWEHRNAEIGTLVFPKYWGTGVNTQAKNLLINYAFNQLGMQRLHLRISEKNVRSYKATEKLGAVFEGVARRSTKIHGRYHNMRVYSILPEEWREHRRQLRE